MNVIPITAHPAYHNRRSLKEMAELLEKSIERRKDMIEHYKSDEAKA